MTTTLAIANQKGGVAKTTTVASVGAALAELGNLEHLVARAQRPSAATTKTGRSR